MNLQQYKRDFKRYITFIENMKKHYRQIYGKCRISIYIPNSCERRVYFTIKRKQYQTHIKFENTSIASFRTSSENNLNNNHGYCFQKIASTSTNFYWKSKQLF